MKRTLPMVAALGSMLWFSTVSALGLGEIDVRSRLNQRFVASIPLASLGVDEAETVRVSLAGAAEFERAGIERSDYLSTLNFVVATDGAPRIEISSAQVAREPFLNFLIDVRASSGRLLREYTVLLDPPDTASSGTAIPVRPVAQPAPSQTEFYETAEEATRRPQPVPAPVLTPVEPAAAPVPAAEPVMMGEETGSEGTYGPVQSGETFWSIATRLRPGSTVTMDQMLLAIYENNRAAFDGGINGLRRGAMLNVPSIDSIRAVAPAAARDEVARLRGLTERRVASSAAQPAPAPAVVSQPIAAPVRVQPITPPPAEPVVVDPPVEPATMAPTSESSAPPPSDLGTATVIEPVTTGELTTDSTQDPAASSDSALDDPALSEPAVDEPAEVSVPEPAPAIQSTPEAGSSLLETLLLPLLGGLLVLGGVVYLVSRIIAKRRRAAPPPEAAPVLRPKAVAAPVPVAAPASRKLSAKEQLEQLQESVDGDAEAPPARTQQTPVAKTAAPQARTQQLETEQFTTQQLSTQQVATQKLDASAAEATRIFEVPPAPPPAEAVDFDLTGQFESQTVQINLDANDPLSEADFHLAYGLYDEAALLLKQASAKEPARVDLQTKLAETYFAAGKSAEFQQVAEALKPRLSPADWQKLAIMGQQMQPGNALFQTEGGSADVAMDLSFDELAAPPAATPPPKSAAAAPKAAPAQVIDDGLDFSLEDLELSTLEQGGGDGLAIAKDKGNELEFDLGDFDAAVASKPATQSAPPAPAAAPADNSLEFDLDQFDAPAPAPVSAPAAPRTPAHEAATAVASAADVDVDNFDFGEMPSDSSTISGDEAGTKLDLARAYVDMGDDDMARSLLSEVLEQGSEPQQQDAKALLSRLG